MADRAKKVSELTSLTAASGDDLLLIVDDPSGTPATKKITVDALFTGSAVSNGAFANIAVTDTATIATGNIDTISTITLTSTDTITSDIGNFANVTSTDTITGDIGNFANVTSTDTMILNDVIAFDINTVTINSTTIDSDNGIIDNLTTENASITNATISNFDLVDNYTPLSNPIDPTLNKLLGSIFWDENYLYVTYKDNHVKRIALESFFFLSANLFQNENSFYEGEILTN